MGKISNFYSGREGEHEGKLWGKTTENDTSKHMEPGEQGVCGREHKLSTTVSSYVMCHGFVQFDAAKERMMLKSLCCQLKLSTPFDSTTDSCSKLASFNSQRLE